MELHSRLHLLTPLYMINQKAKDYAAQYPYEHHIADAWMDGYRTGCGKKTKKELDLSFVAEPFIVVINKWMDYKRERKQGYTQRGIKSCYNNLIELSNHNPDTAAAIVEQSIANNYAGLFTLKNGKQITSQTNAQSAGMRTASVNELADLSEKLLQSVGGKKY